MPAEVRTRYIFQLLEISLTEDLNWFAIPGRPVIDTQHANLKLSRNANSSPRIRNDDVVKRGIRLPKPCQPDLDHHLQGSACGPRRLKVNDHRSERDIIVMHPRWQGFPPAAASHPGKPVGKTKPALTCRARLMQIGR